MNIFIREVKANFKALIIWSICMFLFVLIEMAKFTTFAAGAAGSSSVTDLLGIMPKSIRALLGFSNFNLSTMAGYFGVVFIYTQLIAAIHAALLGAGIISKEEGYKTVEFLMIKPVSRSYIITSKLFAALLNIVVINIVSLISSIFLASVYNKGKGISEEIVLMMSGMFMVQLIFLSLGVLLAAAMKNPKASGSIAIGILLAGYFSARITDISDKLNFLILISPFKYFDLQNIAAKNVLNIEAVYFSLGIAVVFFVLTYLFYTKRDLKV